MLPQDYDERVYAGVLGKIIGVYLGRPFEGWSNARIERELGDIDYYVHDRLGVRLIVTDDDIAGTFTFIRALEDYGCDPAITPAQIGQTWLNYLIEGRTILWWGGLGNSTEHTAYLRLKAGIEAPRSGSAALNGKVVAEQIGAQIFIDGWAMVCPGDPERAADFARRAGSVSHDGEAVHGAQVLAAMEAQAFVEDDIDKLFDTGIAFAPADSVVRRMIDDIRDWRAGHGDDWRATFRRIQAQYGYDKYGGNCHIVPNHGLIALALLHGDGDFGKSLRIVNTAGWDTDCNSGNVGCLMGIRGGLAGIDAGADWRGPIADICYLPSADSGGAISDAVSEATRIAGIGRRLANAPLAEPKQGARFHFSHPGAVQGFQGERCVVHNAAAPSGGRALAIDFHAQPEGAARATTATFIDSLETARYFDGRGYALAASPTLNPGQTVTARLMPSPATQGALEAALCVRVFNDEDALETLHGPPEPLAHGAWTDLSWDIPATDGHPIAAVGVAIIAPRQAGTVFLDRLTWHGAPEVTLAATGGKMWRRAWVRGIDQVWALPNEGFRLVQNQGTGLLLYGTRDWRDYRVAADITPHLARRVGLVARAQGMKRHYALTLTDANKLKLVRELEGTTTLAEADCDLDLYTTHHFELTVVGDAIVGRLNHAIELRATDTALKEGGIALLLEEGRAATREVTVAAPQR